MITKSTLFDHFGTLTRLLAETETSGIDSSIALEDAVGTVIEQARTTHGRGNKIMFVGNGGSAAIASHMAIDWSKNGGLRSTAFNDSSALTCLGNDFGYEHVFAKQIEMHGRDGDMLVAVSSSGRSANILNACEAGRRIGCQIVTFSGFSADNPLRRLGGVNFYVRSDQYGFVEMAHLVLCHTVIDLAMRTGADV